MKIIVLGSTGHVGRELVPLLTAKGATVTAVSRDGDAKTGGTAAKAAVTDVPSLHDVLGGGQRAFLLNPPADPSGDKDQTERKTAEAIVRALEGSGLDRVVAQSTFGARAEEGFGDLSVLHHFETLLAAQPIPAAIMRASYLMSNQDAPAAAARESGVLKTMLPEDCILPMVSPRDLATVAADLLTQGSIPGQPVHVEGPERYSPRDVAAALAEVAGRPIRCHVIRRDDWVAAYVRMGFSDKAAQSYARMTTSAVDERSIDPSRTVKGTVTLHDHFAATA